MYLIKKEYKALSRNSRSYWLLFMAFAVPFAIFFLLFRFSASLIQEQIEGSNKKRFKVAWIAEGNEASEIKKKLDLHLQIDIIDSLSEDDMIEALETDSISVGILIASGFDSSLAKQEKTEITLYYKGGSKALNIVEKTIGNYRREITKKNILEKNLPEAVVNPIEIKEEDLSSMQEMIDNMTALLNRSISTLLSLLLLVFGVLGARFALRSLFWNEQENGLYNIHVQSVTSSGSIYLSKLLMAALFSWKMMLLALLGFAAALSFDQEGIMQGIMLQIRSLLNWNSLGLLLLTAVPLSFLFSSFWGIFGFWTKKDMALFLSNLSFLLLFLLFLASGSSTVLLNTGNAFIPFMNLILMIKSLMAGESETMMSLLAIAAMIIWALIFAVLNLYRYKNLKI